MATTADLSAQTTEELMAIVLAVLDDAKANDVRQLDVRRLTEWYRWTELLELAHIAVMGRPGWHLPAILPDWWIQARADTGDDLVKCAAGSVVCVDVPQLNISSTGVRTEILQGTVSTEILPEPVVNYIKDHALYGYHN